eukprot:CAMPEP_0168170478 /NCGR_PEP_ID=MMETSP0139_2-20121125/4202_1 /TAXON_ID=44445 /ORGANISM="Pseudo-nitzschia australis, Strain 10249 10 AB" /LENGTH=173 /DNA_ID=CAMNT_0008087985 /DNA_START=188 /DNA_END=709 /DNA_ORIENTATION=+
MPAFSSENPIQALYLKKKGVERLLARKSGTTYLSPKFAKETKKRIERQSMLIKRTEDIEEANDEDRYMLAVPIALESIPSASDFELRDEAPDNEMPDLASYDNDSSVVSIDWSLPGVGEENVDIRFDYSDTDFYDIDQRKKRTDKEELRKRSNLLDTAELGFATFMCNGGGCI